MDCSLIIEGHNVMPKGAPLIKLIHSRHKAVLVVFQITMTIPPLKMRVSTDGEVGSYTMHGCKAAGDDRTIHTYFYSSGMLENHYKRY